MEERGWREEMLVVTDDGRRQNILKLKILQHKFKKKNSKCLICTSFTFINKSITIN